MGWSAADPLVDADSLGPVLLVSAAVLVVCIVAVRLTARSGLPTLLAYLAVGLVLGEEGLGINFSSAEIGQVLGYSALILILAEGGLTTRWSSIRNAVAPAVTLSTVGVVVSVFVTAAAAHWLLGWSWQVSLLVGAIVSSTDAAAVFSVLRTVPLPRRISGMLEAESGFNDAPVVMLVVAITTSLANPAEAQPWWTIGILAVVQLSVGTVIGAAVGYVGGGLLRRTAAATSGLFAIGVVSVSVLAFGAATMVGTSGFIACYAALSNNDADFVLIPEVPFVLDGPNGVLRRVEDHVRRHGQVVIVVAEGAGQELLEQEGRTTDASGNTKLGDIGLFLKQKITDHLTAVDLPPTVRYLDPSYAIRSVAANAYDSVYCVRLAHAAVHAGMAGRTETVVVRWRRRFVHVPMELITAHRNQVDPDGDLWMSVLEATGQPATFGDRPS